MVAIRSLTDIVEKWSKETPTRAPYYESGVKAPSKDWATEAKAGQKAYEDAMRNPSTLALREKKIAAVGSEKWQRKATKVGPSRFREGVPAAKEDYSKGFSDAHGVISAWTPPERGPRGDPKNYEIVKSIGDALHKKRVGAA